MTDMIEQSSDETTLQDSIEKMTTLIWGIAENCQGNSQELLFLLRHLEQAHRKIRTELFEASLPDNRQSLYHLLREIEDEGGWPYIERMRLKQLLHLLSQDNNSVSS
ncbi:MAG: hypothetical protein AB4041_08225 [Microcystaceae cyanobacterium]